MGWMSASTPVAVGCFSFRFDAVMFWMGPTRVFGVVTS